MKPAEETSHRNKRHAEYPWVVRSADGNPILNRRGEDTEEGLMHARRRSQQQRPRGRTEESLVRNHQDETFYTVDSRGRRFYPSGVKEMRDRLPPVSTETSSMYTDTRHAPEIRTRSLPIVRRLGQGSNQVKEYFGLWIITPLKKRKFSRAFYGELDNNFILHLGFRSCGYL